MHYMEAFAKHQKFTLTSLKGDSFFFSSSNKIGPQPLAQKLNDGTSAQEHKQIPSSYLQSRIDCESKWISSQTRSQGLRAEILRRLSRILPRLLFGCKRSKVSQCQCKAAAAIAKKSPLYDSAGTSVAHDCDREPSYSSFLHALLMPDTFYHLTSCIHNPLPKLVCQQTRWAPPSVAFQRKLSQAPPKKGFLIITGDSSVLRDSTRHPATPCSSATIFQLSSWFAQVNSLKQAGSTSHSSFLSAESRNRPTGITAC